MTIDITESASRSCDCRVVDLRGVRSNQVRSICLSQHHCRQKDDSEANSGWELIRESEGIKMSDLLYQVTYVGPVHYEGSDTEQEQLRAAVQSFIEEHARTGSGIVAVKVGFLLGMFLVYMSSSFDASLLPHRFEEWERFYDSTEMASEKVFTRGEPFYRS